MSTKDDEVEAFEGDGRGVTNVREDMKGATLAFCSVRRLLTITRKRSSVSGLDTRGWGGAHGKSGWRVRVRVEAFGKYGWGYVLCFLKCLPYLCKVI